MTCHSHWTCGHCVFFTHGHLPPHLSTSFSYPHSPSHYPTYSLHPPPPSFTAMPPSSSTFTILIHHSPQPSCHISTCSHQCSELKLQLYTVMLFIIYTYVHAHAHNVCLSVHPTLCGHVDKFARLINSTSPCHLIHVLKDGIMSLGRM
jgi:hypothetical protein